MLYTFGRRLVKRGENEFGYCSNITDVRVLYLRSIKYLYFFFLSSGVGIGSYIIYDNTLYFKSPKYKDM